MNNCETSESNQKIEGLYISIPITRCTRTIDIERLSGKRHEVSAWYSKKRGSTKIVFTTNPSKQPCKTLGTYDITTNEYTPEKAKTKESQLDLHISSIVQNFQRYGWRK